MLHIGLIATIVIAVIVFVISAKIANYNHPSRDADDNYRDRL